MRNDMITSLTSLFFTSRARNPRKYLFLFSLEQLSSWTYSISVNLLFAAESIRARIIQFMVRLASCLNWLKSTMAYVFFPCTMAPTICVFSIFVGSQSCNNYTFSSHENNNVNQLGSYIKQNIFRTVTNHSLDGLMKCYVSFWSLLWIIYCLDTMLS